MKLKELLNVTAGCQLVNLEKHEPTIDVTFSYMGTCAAILECLKRERLVKLSDALVRNIQTDDGVLVIKVEVEEFVW